MMSPALHRFRDFAQARWGTQVGKIMLSTGVACPQRAHGGCLYCSAESYRPYYLDPADPVTRQLARGKEHLKKLSTRQFLASFQTETSTAGEPERLFGSYAAAFDDPDCLGMVISTRPDALAPGFLEQLDHFAARHPAKLVLIELGLQTARNDSLRWLQRGHAAEDFAQAAAQVRAFPRFELGAHLILGIPGETVTDMQASVRWAVASGATHLKFHHLQVVRGTPLASQYQERPFPLPNPSEYLDLLCALLPGVPPSVVIHRFWSNCQPDLLVAPRWGLSPNRLYRLLTRRMAERGVAQGCASPTPPGR